jgi:hypothetical protein
LPDVSEVKTESENSPDLRGIRRLDGWGEIASFLSRGIRTVRRWEKDSGLPVRRLFRHPRSRVHAYRKELAHWVERQEGHPSRPSDLKPKSQLGGPPNVSVFREILTGWKEVAAFLGRSVRTVQRREKEMGLPMRRLKAKGHSNPYALRSELVAWMKENRLPLGDTRHGGLGLKPLHLLQTVIDGWGACIAVLNKAGTIVAINRAWEKSVQSKTSGTVYWGVGKNYVDVCKSLSRAKTGPTPTATKGVTELLSGIRQSLQISYRANNSTKKRWFLLQSANFNFRGADCYVLIHSDVTGLFGG